LLLLLFLLPGSWRAVRVGSSVCAQGERLLTLPPPVGLLTGRLLLPVLSWQPTAITAVVPVTVWWVLVAG